MTCTWPKRQGGGRGRALLRIGVCIGIFASAMGALVLPLRAADEARTSAAAAATSPAAPTTQSTPIVTIAELDRLVRQLGHPAWRMRERAQDRLAELDIA